MRNQIYGIYDNVAETLIGGLHLHRHEAPAIRMFGDIATMPNSQIALHPSDFDLIRLGSLEDDTSIIAKKEIILTGATWSAAQTQPELKLDASQ